MPGESEAYGHNERWPLRETHKPGLTAEFGSYKKEGPGMVAADEENYAYYNANLF
jgi:hypothetical protein